MSLSRQYPLELAYAADYAAEDFIRADANLAMLRLIEDWETWPNRAAALWGPAGSGKTHVAHIWAEAADARRIDLDAFRAIDLAAAPPRLALDLGAATLAENDERRMFHLLNLTRERAGALLLVARDAPARWDVRLPDLASRLRALPAAAAEPPGEGLFGAVLAKVLADRRLVIDRRTVDYLAMRSERTFAALQTLARRLDHAALAGRRPITRRLAEDVMKDITQGEGAAKTGG